MPPNVDSVCIICRRGALVKRERCWYNEHDIFERITQGRRCHETNLTARRRHLPHHGGGDGDGARLPGGGPAREADLRPPAGAADCGIAWSAPPETREALESALAAAEVEFAGICEMEV